MIKPDENFNGYWIPWLLLDMMRQEIINDTEMLLTITITYQDWHNMGGEMCTCSNVELVGLTGISSRNVSDALTKLEDIGLITVYGTTRKRCIKISISVDGYPVRCPSTKFEKLLDELYPTSRGK